MSDDLEARLKGHARSFDSLLSLIPAKLYYGEDNSDQWKRRKQTPEQKRAAKRAKLDPDNWKSAKDVADEREAAARKRKRAGSDDSSDSEIEGAEKPKVEQDTDHPKSKKRKTADTSKETPEEKQQRKQQEKAAKKEKRRERKEKVRLKQEKWQARKKAEKAKQKEEKKSNQPRPDSRPSRNDANDNADSSSSEDEDGDGEVAQAVDVDEPSAFTSNSLIEDDGSSAESSDDHHDEVFSPTHESGTSSISSIQTPIIDAIAKSKPAQSPPKAVSQPKQTTSASQPLGAMPDAQSDPKARLQAALSAFKSARTPTNPSKPQPKSRAELLAQRRAQEEHRKAEKKAQRAREKEEEARKQEEEIARRFSPGGSGSLLGSPRSPIIHSPSSEANNFSFGRVAFEDGTALNPDGESSHYRKKGPQDPRTALAAAQSKQARISGLDAEKRENIESKNLWSNARKRASGEKVKDDTSLLKKALKRHDSQKKKSEKEWTERQDGINRSIEMRQKKRTDNLAKRRDEKGGHKGKKAGKVKRPGFEGSFRGRTGGGKKKN